MDRHALYCHLVLLDQPSLSLSKPAPMQNFIVAQCVSTQRLKKRGKILPSRKTSPPSEENKYLCNRGTFLQTALSELLSKATSRLSEILTAGQKQNAFRESAGTERRSPSCTCYRPNSCPLHNSRGHLRLPRVGFDPALEEVPPSLSRLLLLLLPLCRIIFRHFFPPRQESCFDPVPTQKKRRLRPSPIRLLKGALCSPYNFLMEVNYTVGRPLSCDIL